MSVYYNDNDPKCCAWLRELIVDGLIPAGVVDCRSITDIDPESLAGFTQCHFFAGIGGWPLALSIVGWPSDREVWTGSCPCQPFSCAGKGKGVEDERHLWPAFRRLIEERRPATVFGEQVASKAGREWLSGVRADLEELDYAVGAADLCAAGVGAPHIRQRLWWVADGKSIGLEGRQIRRERGAGTDAGQCRPSGDSASSGVANPETTEWGSVREEHTGRGHEETGRPSGDSRGMGNGIHQGPEGHRRLGEEQVPEGWQGTERHSAASSWNGSAIWHPCRDGKQRRIPAEPTLFPLAHGIPGRVGLLRGAGNAIVPAVAAEFIAACMLAQFDCTPSAPVSRPDAESDTAIK